MGASASTASTDPSKYDNFYEIINDIATNYILTMDFKSMKSLAEKEYCDNLVILTGDIIARYFTDMQVQYLEQKIKGGEEVNDMTTQNVIYFNKDTLDNVDIQNDRMKSIKKKRVCIGIAKYYVKIAHIFAAIVTTINPVYVYKDGATGERIKKTLFEKGEIPKGVYPAIYKVNICDNRIKALKRVSKEGDMEDDAAEVGDDITMHPKICEMNANRVNLDDEPGMAELEKLYLDDEYDYSTGTFRGMSAETARQYRADLRTFYIAFTGETDMPDSIQRFSDIKLRQYKTMNGCSGNDPVFAQKQRISKKDKLYIAYANNISSMIDKANTQQKKLLEVINMLFAYVEDPYTGKQKIRINPALNDSVLQKTIVMTRQIIVQLYVGCEEDYVKGVKLYEAIVESQILETTKRQINNLEQRATNITDSYKPVAASPKSPIQSQREADMRPYQPPIQSQRESDVRPYQPPVQSQREADMRPYQPPMQPQREADIRPYQPPMQSQREADIRPYQPPIQSQREADMRDMRPYQPPVQPQREADMRPYQPPMQPQREADMRPYQPPMQPDRQPFQRRQPPPFYPPTRLNVQQQINASPPNPFTNPNDNKIPV